MIFHAFFIHWKKQKLFPTSLCGVLVFRLDPAALLRPPPRRTHHYSSLTHSLPPSLPPSLPHSLTPLPPSLPHSLTHSTPSLTHSTHLTHLTHSLTHSLTPSLPPSLPSLTHSTPSLPPSLTHSLTSLTSLTHSLIHSLTQACAVQRACLLRGRRTTQSLLAELRRAWPPLGPRLPLAWQAQYTEPPGRAAARVAGAGAVAAFGVAGAVHRASWTSCGRLAAAGAAAAFGVAGAVHRASWTSCGARGRRWGRGCLWRGRRNIQSLLDELRRAWPPLGPRLPFAWQAQYTGPPGGAAARVAAAGAAAAFCVAGAVYTEPPGRAAARVAAAGAAAAFGVAGAVHRAS